MFFLTRSAPTWATRRGELTGAVFGWWRSPKTSARWRGGGASSVQGMERVGSSQMGVVWHPQARHGIILVRNSIERWCGNQNSLQNEIRGSMTAFYRAFRLRITSTSWTLSLSSIQFNSIQIRWRFHFGDRFSSRCFGLDSAWCHEDDGVRLGRMGLTSGRLG
jgi:hypothetical protein